MTISLKSAIKPGPGRSETQDPDERRQIEASGESYDEAFAALKAQVPDGWLLVGVSRW